MLPPAVVRVNVGEFMVTPLACIIVPVLVAARVRVPGPLTPVLVKVRLP